MACTMPRRVSVTGETFSAVARSASSTSQHPSGVAVTVCSVDHADVIGTPSTMEPCRARIFTAVPLAASTDDTVMVVAVAVRDASGVHVTPSNACSTCTTLPTVTPETTTCTGDPAVTVSVGVAGGVHDTVNVADAAVFETPPVWYTRTQALSDCPLVHGESGGAVSGPAAVWTTPESHSAPAPGSVAAAGMIHTR